ncbi:MAG: asparagine synthase-related protein [Thermodesulfobacteriota bacterium]
MGGVAVQLNLNKEPIEGITLLKFNEVNKHSGDFAGSFSDKNIGFAYRFKKQKHLSSNVSRNEIANTSIIFDGRIDNRTELNSILEKRDSGIDKLSDAKLISLLYKIYGIEFLKLVIGEFIISIWDEKIERLICVRDRMGTKPLYYYHDSKTFICASELAQLFQYGKLRIEPNECMVGEYISLNLNSNKNTFYKNVYRIEPACYLAADSSVHKQERYWDVSADKKIYYKSENEYVEHFSELFCRSLDCRIKGADNIGIYLSGGIDSSSVVCMANEMFQNNNIYEDKNIETYSLIFPGMDCDENSYINGVKENIEINSNLFEPDINDYKWLFDDTYMKYYLPTYPTLRMMSPIMKAGADKNVDLFLSGQGGDEMFMGSSYYIFDLVKNIKIKSLLIEVNDLLKNYGFSYTLSFLKNFVIKPSVPEILKPYYKKFKKYETAPWINFSFAKKFDIDDKLHIRKINKETMSKSDNDRYEKLSDGMRVLNFESFEQFATNNGVDESHPFFDSRIVDFTFSIPESQKISRNEQRIILRRALRNLLPNDVYNRNTKAHFDTIVINSLFQPEILNVLKNLKIVETGWINRDFMKDKLDKLLLPKRNEYLSSRDSNILATIVTIELWYRSVFA